MTLRTTIFAALALAMLGFVAGPALAASQGNPGTYRDPKARFVLAVPPDARVTEKGDGTKLAYPLDAHTH